ncbi:MAG: DUF5107 domain-containing protein [Sphaerochaeta sp.]|uniref:DUF5107 domain-containing protein n=1 Tax=Sphaerochaeta sp. TaxID=1972642 RepID=UPI003D110120
MTTVTKGVFLAQAALPTGENPLPVFRDPNHDVPVRVKDGVPLSCQKLMGFDCGKRVLPYRMQDRYDRHRTHTEIPAIFLENHHLKATFLPSLGGRLISLVDKHSNRELLYCNTSLQVGNLANRDAWFAGGIEWNIGQYGHAFTTCSPVFASEQQDANGQSFLRVYEFERCKNLWWHIDFHLSEDAPLLYAHVQIHNLSDADTSLYYWTNAAVTVDEQVRVLASNRNAVYLDPYAPKGERLFGFAQMPDMEIYPGLDASYPARFSASNEYFFTCERDPLPWECALSGDGSGFCEASTAPLSYRKMFCWGSHVGGKRWQRYLAPDSDADYIELQSGLACTQLHGQILEAHSSVCWTQAFALVQVDPSQAHAAAYADARKAAGKAIESLIDRRSLEALHQTFAKASSQPVQTLLHIGSGWGYVEQKLARMELPFAFLFNRESLGTDQLAYLQLINEGFLPVMNPLALPLAPPPCSASWKACFLRALHSPGLTPVQRATLQHYLGIIHLEDEEVSLAQTCWLEVMAVLPNAWTARNLAQLEQRRNQVEESLRWYATAFQLPGFLVDPAMAEEYCTLLVSMQQTEKALEVFAALDPAWLKASERLILLRAKLAAREGDAPLIKTLVFERELGHIREGDTTLNELWLAYQVILYTQEHHTEATEEVIARVKQLHPIPARYDLTMFS